jgi:DNA-binding XRE family transcriptional regulator
MARKTWANIRRHLGPEREARVAARVAELKAEMPLAELRRAREFTQQTLATVLGESQASVSQVERQADMYVSTLRKYVEAMGGELEIRVRFPEGEVRITQFAVAAA